MTAETTFREFVEEAGFNFCMLEFDSPEYTSLVMEFNEAKLKLEAEAEAIEREEMKARLGFGPQPKARHQERNLLRSEG